MSINPELLICPPIFQNFIEGKDGKPLIAGVVTFYEDSNHTIFKNVYQQTGSYPNYTYVPAPNPMTLSAAASTVDGSGNDILLFFYPWSETDEEVSQPYFITVYDRFNTLQFTRQNFPLVSTETNPSPTPNFVTQQNYIINNRFWRNIGTLTPTDMNNTGTWTTQYSSSGPEKTYWTIAPDQHDGFSMPDLNYLMSSSFVGNATETIEFLPFTAELDPLIENDIQPEYYLHHQCTSDSEVYVKTYQFPISFHLATLANQPFVFTIQGKGSIILNIYLYSFSGSGAISSDPLLVGNIQLSDNWTKWTFTNTSFPDFFGTTLSTTGDDAYYLQISFNSGEVDFDIAIPSIYIYDNIDSTVDGIQLFSFSTYDQIDAIVSSPRTGDIRTSINKFYPFGWLPMNDGTIGNSLSNATSRANKDAWTLYDLIWQNFNTISLNGSPLIPIFTSGGDPTTYGSTSLADWTANNAISLTKMMGQVILGTVPLSQLIAAYMATFTASQPTSVVTGSNDTGTLLLNISSSLPIAFAVVVQFTHSGAGTLPGGISAATNYYMTPLHGNAFNVSTSLANAQNGVYVRFTTTGGGTTTATVFSLALTSANSLNLFTGMPVTFGNSSGALPGGLSSNTIYYAVVATATIFYVSTTFGNSISGNVLPFVNVGSGTNTVFVSTSAAYEGEYNHTPLMAELAEHTHTNPVNVYQVQGTAQPSFGGSTSFTTDGGTALNLSTMGNSTKFNVTQPGVFYNIYIKL